MKKGAVILCGGKSSRMGHDKATLAFGNEKMLQRITRIVSGIVASDAIVVVAAENQILPELPDNVIVARDQRPSRGPLEGLAAGLQAMPPDVDAVYATSCDVPLLKSVFVDEIFKRLQHFDIAVPSEGKFFHPLAAVYRPSVMHIIRMLLSQDRLRPVFLFEETNTISVPIEELRSVDPNLESLMNLNQPEDYQAALNLAGLGKSDKTS